MPPEPAVRLRCTVSVGRLFSSCPRPPFAKPPERSSAGRPDVQAPAQGFATWPSGGCLLSLALELRRPPSCAQRFAPSALPNRPWQREESFPLVPARLPIGRAACVQGLLLKHPCAHKGRRRGPVQLFGRRRFGLRRGGGGLCRNGSWPCGFRLRFRGGRLHRGGGLIATGARGRPARGAAPGQTERPATTAFSLTVAVPNVVTPRWSRLAATWHQPPAATAGVRTRVAVRLLSSATAWTATPAHATEPVPGAGPRAQQETNSQDPCANGRPHLPSPSLQVARIHPSVARSAAGREGWKHDPHGSRVGYRGGRLHCQRTSVRLQQTWPANRAEASDLLDFGNIQPLPPGNSGLVHQAVDVPLASP